MGNRAIRKSIQSLRQRIIEHLEKVERERVKPEPDLGLINHWQSEIETFTTRLRRLEDRLAQRQRRGRS
ncbi:MAG: hypothetical protein Fur0044_19790 [Anaerolineae bacterium]